MLSTHSQFLRNENASRLPPRMPPILWPCLAYVEIMQRSCYVSVSLDQQMLFRPPQLVIFVWMQLIDKHSIIVQSHISKLWSRQQRGTVPAPKYCYKRGDYPWNYPGPIQFRMPGNPPHNTHGSADDSSGSWDASEAPREGVVSSDNSTRLFLSSNGAQR